MRDLLIAITSSTATILVAFFGSKGWEYFFSYKGKQLDTDQDRVRFLVEKLYGGVIGEMRTEMTIIKKENADLKNENREIKKDIQVLDRKVAYYEAHLAQTQKGLKIVEAANKLIVTNAQN